MRDNNEFRVYLSGPITGDDEAESKFKNAETVLRSFDSMSSIRSRSNAKPTLRGRISCASISRLLWSAMPLCLCEDGSSRGAHDLSA